MSVNKFNHEGYHDPTAYEALMAIEREAKKTAFRPLVFICSPLAGNVEQNLASARRYARFAVEKGAIPLAPHLLFPQFMDDGDKAQRSLAIFMGLVLMGKCQEVWCFGGGISSGMAIELEKARQRGTPIRYFTEGCAEVKPNA
ncbi:MAG: DUF4406 domain-containing protein [Saccharofermentanales bacterium]|jgi:hypothetical protein